VDDIHGASCYWDGVGQGTTRYALGYDEARGCVTGFETENIATIWFGKGPNDDVTFTATITGVRLE